MRKCEQMKENGVTIIRAWERTRIVLGTTTIFIRVLPSVALIF